MEQQPKKSVSPWIAWSLVALFAGIAGFCIWYYYDQVNAIYDTEVTISYKKSSKKIPTTTKKEEITKPEIEEPADETADWKTYTNEKYGYSFKYPSDYVEGSDCPKPCKGQVSTSEGGDSVIVEGDISEKGWPMIDISHHDSEIYNPTGGENLLDWLKLKATGDIKDNLPDSTTEIETDDGSLEVVKISIPGSPQAYSRWEIYFMDDDKIFSIQMLDVESEEAQDFYNLWLSTFKK